MGLPHESTRRILLCVSGMTPQIITETLQELLRAPAAFVPTQIHVITTAVGESKARAALETKGQLAALCAQYGVTTPPLDFSVITTADREPLTDIRDDTDNTLAADTILDCVRTLTQDADSAIHASLAGGRKTMSHYMGYAMSLFGRTQDRLSHVLVAPDWAERAADFYFKPTHNAELYDREGNALGPSDAVDITLADIPLLRLGDALPQVLREGHANFSETVRLTNLALAPATLKLDLHPQRTECSGIPIDLTTANFAFLTWLAIRAKTEQGGVAINEWTDAEVNQFLDVYAAVVGYNDPDRLEKSHEYYIDADKTLRCDTSGKSPGHVEKIMKARKGYLTSRRGDLKDALVRQLGKPLAKHFLPPTGQRPETRYFLELEPEAIAISGVQLTS